MKPKNKRKGIDRTAPRCPYCGSHTILRSADGIYRENARNDMLYVCKNYPVCDSYVRVQRGTKIPLELWRTGNCGSCGRKRTASSTNYTSTAI